MNAVKVLDFVNTYWNVEHRSREMGDENRRELIETRLPVMFVLREIGVARVSVAVISERFTIRAVTLHDASLRQDEG